MATNVNEIPFERGNISGGIQRKTTKFEKKPNEVDLGVNADFSRIGGVQKVSGMSKLGNQISTSTTTSTSTSTSTSTTTTSTSTSSSTSSSTSTSSTTTGA